ncbi:hypothetical protein DV736_g5754, partial [Chaetothyriales sp. CBS 134916]
MVWEQLSITKPHLVYIILGGFTSIFMLVSLFIKEKLYIGEATVATLCGVIFGPHAANLINPLTWGNTDLITLEFSRIVLVTQCFAVGVELPRSYMERHWRSVLFLLVPVMTFGWLITSLFIWWMIVPLSWLESLVVAACVTATDPVLASSVVGKGKFAKRVPKHLRDVLSAESGCNDGMAFPFIYLALYLVRYDLNAEHTVYHWICLTILYECIFGAIYGVVVGYIGRHMIKLAERKGIIDRESFLVFYFVLALFCAGSGSLLGLDDLLVGFAAGVGFSNDGWFSEKTEESHVSNVIDLLINLTYFVYFGAIIPWEQYNSPSHGLVPWRLVVISIMVIFFRRIPAMLLCKPFIPDIKNWREALFAGHFGPIGVGAIFVAILARAELESESTTPLAKLPPPGSKDYDLIYLVWPVVTFLVISSILVHGSSIAVFTLGKRINTLTITLSYTIDNEKGPAWMHRLPRISSQSKSMSRASSISDTDEKLDLPPGTLPGPGGLPNVFLRPQRDEEYEGKTSSRTSSLRPSRRRKRKTWDSEVRPGGPISASAIHPALRSDSNAANLESGSETLFDKSGDPSPQTPIKSVETSPDSRSGSVSPSRRHDEAQVDVYEEGGDIIIEDSEGNVLDAVESKDLTDEGKAAKIEDLRQKLKHDDSGKRTKGKGQPHAQQEGEEHEQLKLMQRLANWKGFGRYKQDETGESSEHARAGHTKVRGPAHAYQFGNTIIVEDEDGEVIKSYTLPPVEGERKRTYGQEQLRHGMNRMSTWVGLGKAGLPVTSEGAADAITGDEAASSQQQQPSKRTEKSERRDSDNSGDDDGLRMTISRTDRYGLTGLQKNLDTQGRPLGTGRRMSTRDFLKQMQQMDGKKIQEVEESDAPEELKQEVRSTAKAQKAQKAAEPSGRKGPHDRPPGDEGVESQSGGDYFSAAHRPQAPRAQTSQSIEMTEEEVPTHDVRSSIIRYGRGQTAADARRRRLAPIISSEEQDELAEDEDEQAETAAEKRRRLAALGIGGVSREDDSEESDEDVVRLTRQQGHGPSPPVSKSMAIAGMALSLPPHCTPTTPFLREFSACFHTCVPTLPALLSTALGTLSIVSWLFAQLPQIYKNYHLKSTAGLSIFFLVEWTAGDATNLAGGLLTKQATWQVVLASYYVFVDVCLVVQYFWYTYIAPRLYGETLLSGPSSLRGGDDGDSINGLSPINTSFSEGDGSMSKDGDETSDVPPSVVPIGHSLFAPINYEKSRLSLSTSPEKVGQSWISSASPRTLMLGAALVTLASPSRAAPVGFPNDHFKHPGHLLLARTPDEVAGTIFSWCSTVLYLGSRLPQLYKNWQRQSTTGLSPLLFLAAFCGNLFYSTSLLTNPNAWNDFGPYGGHGWVDKDGSERDVWLARSAPFFIGAAGVLVMDGFMGLQFLMYGGGQEQVVVKVRDVHGRSHWERVSGWMRGWIPNMTDKAKVVDLAESQRLLGERVGSSNNYAYLVSDEKTHDAIIIDPANPPEVTPVLEKALKGSLNLTAIVNTHHHWDHAGGNRKLLDFLGPDRQVPIIGGKDCEAVTRTPAHKEKWTIGKDIDVTALHTPCHTQDSICWFMQDRTTNEHVVFTGDTLFIGGCGKFFEGTAEEMNTALNSILAALPDDTKVYPGHEYTKSNVKFLEKIDGGNDRVKALKRFANENQETQGRFTIADEKAHNVFMRTATDEMKRVTGESAEVGVMAKLREMKNNM